MKIDLGFKGSMCAFVHPDLTASPDGVILPCFEEFEFEEIIVFYQIQQ